MTTPQAKHGPWGFLYSARRLISRILFFCGHSSRRRVAADAHQRPTRRFRQLSTPSTKICRWGPRSEPPGRIGPMRDASLALGPRTPSLFGLAPCGVYPAPGLTAGAVRSYRTFSPLPLRGAAFRPPDCSKKLPHAVAVCFLWHWPSTGLKARVPDVIRHTALRSSDFPPPGAMRLRAKCPAATARSSCQGLV